MTKRMLDLLLAFDQAAFTSLYLEGYIGESGITNKGLAEIKKHRVIPDMLECAKQLKALWPVGSGPYGPWSSASIIIKKRLEQFTNKYGVYPMEEIVDAGRRYVNCPEFAADKTYMQTLDNFIFYDKIGAAGTVDEKSKLLTFIEDKTAGQVNNQDQFTDIR